MTSTTLRRPLLAGLVCAFAAAAAALFAPAASADDRDVLRDAAARPYVFVFLDNSRTMNFRPPCDATDIAAGKCDAADFCAPAEGCRVPRDGDDPVSKFRIAREALYEVLESVTDVDFGFAVMNQDLLRVQNKHWNYKVAPAASQPSGFFTLAGGVTFPTAGTNEFFGASIGCPTGSADANVGCMPPVGDCGGSPTNRLCAPADTDDVGGWEMERFRRLPRLGAGGATATSYYLRVPTGPTRYKVTYSKAGPPANYSDTGSINVDVQIQTCSNNDCTSFVAPVSGVSKTIVYNAVGQFLISDPKIARTGTTATMGWLGYTDALGDPAAGCGWEGNEDSASDAFSSYNLNWPDLEPTDAQDPWADPDRLAGFPSGGDNPPSAFTFSSGDLIPWDWLNSNQPQVLEHLGSKHFLAPGVAPFDDDFGQATYMNDTRQGADTFLRLANASQRTLLATENPDLAWALGGFRTWYRGCLNGACPRDLGWDDVAAVQDTRWACRRKFLLVVTDGDIDDDTSCSGPNRNACSLTASMRAQDDITTFVIALGRENTGHNILNCMAHNGGSGEPIYPKNKADLVLALTEIIGRVREQAAAFASAAVPQVQANATDKIFLSSFTPLNDTGYWAGRLDAFLKPLPLDDRGQPDRSVVCDNNRQAECFLWDAGDVQAGLPDGTGVYTPGRLLLQAPDSTELADTPPWNVADLQLGVGADERRVVYTEFAETGNRRLFAYPSTNAQKYDLWTGMGIPFVVGSIASETAANNDANATIATTLVEKEGVVDAADPANPSTIIHVPITYLMGDIFHADPVVVSRPNNFNYYNSDPYLNKALCGAPADPTRTPPPSYRWFADRNFCRRSLLITAANDGQLHVFDGGIFGGVGGADTECMLPAKDLDGNGTASADEWSDGVVDYDIGDDVDGFKTCSNDASCGTGPCIGGICRDVKVGILEGAYDNGTGREVFSFIPRGMLKTVHWMANGADRNKDFWGMDGSPRIDDVFIDPLATEGSSPTCLDREWRTVAIGGYREGGPGYYALDITQPDRLDADHVPLPVNGYVPSCFDGTGSGCNSRPYPSVLWEFDDSASVETSPGLFITEKLDEDLNGVPDLGNSWSRASTGRIRVCTGACNPDDAEDRFVAVFGGGVGDSPGIGTGNFIYMVDVETGRTIYKKPVIGAAPADVAAVDSNSDGYIDRLYVGTTSGLVYKVQLENSAGSPHRLVSQTVQTRVGASNYNMTVTRLQGPVGEAGKYDPFQVFSTGGKPIYHEISAIFVAQKNRIAMAFGTGNRWDLWDSGGTEGRFYVILDDNFSDSDHDGVLNITCSGCTQPLTESKYTALDPATAYNAADPVVNYLLTGGGSGTLPGWYFTLDPNEKVITEAFSLSGVTIFTSFVPTTAVNNDGTCSRAGTSRIFIVGTVTALGYNVPAGGTIADRTRYTEIQQFTTPPFVEQSATANPEAGGSDDQHADFVTDSLAAIRDELKTLQSNRCRYANYTQNIKTIRSDTGVVFVAPIPLCLDPTSWKEF